MAIDHSTFGTSLTLCAALLEQHDTDADAATTGYRARFDELDGTAKKLTGARRVRFEKALDDVRARHSELLQAQRARAMFDPLILAYLHDVVGRHHDEVNDEAWDDLQKHWVDNTYSIKERNWNRGSVSAGGGNAGSGTVLRLAEDDRNLVIEQGHPGTIVVRCKKDHNTGTKRFQSEFDIFHATPAIDALEERDYPPNLRGTLTEAHPAAGKLLQNPGFDSDAATASLSSLTGWTVDAGTIGNHGIVETGFRTEAGASAARCLKVTENLTISQTFSARDKNFNLRLPYFHELRYNRETGSAAGSVVSTLGAKSTTTNLAAETGWNAHRKAMDQDCWYRQFKADDVKFTLAFTVSSGYLLVDTCVLQPMTKFNGLFYVVAGAADDFHEGDIFTFADAFTGSDSVTQKWLCRAYGNQLTFAFLRHASSPTIADDGIG